MWSFVRTKKNQRWLWHGIDRATGKVLAYVFCRQDEVFLQLKKLLEQFGIQKYCTNGWGAYEGSLSPHQHEIGKREMLYRLIAFLTSIN